ncbi:MAG TPA: hypothetical protein VJL35_07105 [Gemmatimonadaceae bacterium]|nr:hypothetical protein [Gemmatimonadaceae bacterium]
MPEPQPAPVPTTPVNPPAPVTPGTPSNPGNPRSLHISGGMSPWYQGIRVVRNGVPDLDAKVTVNGVLLQHCCAELYVGNLPDTLPAGSAINLKVVAGAMTFEATGKVIPTPVITAPVSETTFLSTEYVSLTWSTPTDPDKFEVCLNCWENALEGEIYPVPGTTRSFTIAPGHLVDYLDSTVVAVYARKDHFLEWVDTPAISSDVQFIARSRDTIVHIKGKYASRQHG